MEKFSKILSLIGDASRSKILWALLDGKAYTATELAIFAEVSAQSVSMHLGKLVGAGLLKVEKQGRHRYFKFSRKEVAYAIEGLAGLVEEKSAKAEFNKADNLSIKYCRTCYDHLAGKVGVALTTTLIGADILRESNEQYEVTIRGAEWFKNLGIDVDLLRKSKRSFARPCLDWSERQHHLSGSLGAALLHNFLSSDWVRKSKNSRAIIITAKGQQNIYDLLGITV